MQPILVHLGSTIVPGRILVQEGSITGPGVLITFTAGQPGVLVNTNGVGPGVYVEFDDSAPATPSGIWSFGGAGSASVYWITSAGATSYDLQSSPDNSTWTTISSTQAGTTFLDTAASTTAATTGLVYYRVRATNTSGSSPYTSSSVASPTQFIFDNSTDANGTAITAHIPNINKPGNSWTNPTAGSTGTGTGVIVISGNKFACSGTVGLNGWFGVIDAGIKDVVVTDSVTLPSGGAAGVIARYVDNESLVIAFLDQTGPGSAGGFYLYELDAGTGTVRDSISCTVVPGSTYAVTLTALGSHLTATVSGGSRALSYTLSGSYAGALTSTRAGISFSFGIESISNFGVAAAAPLPATAAWLRGLVGFTTSVWSDQSFNGNDATQATGANQFSPNPSGPGGNAVVNSPDVNRLMDFPDIQPTSGNWSKLVLFKCSDLSGNNNMLSGNTSTGSHTLVLFGTDKASSFLFPSTNLLTSTAVVGNPQTSWGLVLLSQLYAPNFNVNNADAWLDHFHVNGISGGMAPTTEGSHPSIAKISVGGVQGTPGSGFVGDIAEVIVAGEMPSAADVNALINTMNSTYGLSFPTYSKQVVFVGDSITAGGIASGAGGSWPFLVGKNDTSRYYLNKGRPGSYVTNALSDIATNLYPITQCGVPTSATIFFGPNDLSIGGFTGAQVYANIMTLANDLRSHGVGKIVVFTMLPLGPTYETERQNLNNALRAGWTGFADGIADVETMPSGMGAANANTNTTWYNADQLHPNDTGHALLYALFAGVATAISW